MTRLARILLVALFAVAAGAGCTDKSESQTNPELGKPPEIKQGRGAEGKGGAIDPNASKAPVKK